MNCPFCWSAAKLRTSTFGDSMTDYYSVECLNGHAIDYWNEDVNAAISHWNERAWVGSNKTDALVNQLKSTISEYCSLIGGDVSVENEISFHIKTYERFIKRLKNGKESTL